MDGNLLVGSNSSFNQLIITNGATLTNNGLGLLGVNVGANSNMVFLSGPGSRWLKSDSLLVGENGAFNRLIVSNGATVEGWEINYIGFSSTSGLAASTRI